VNKITGANPATAGIQPLGLLAAVGAALCFSIIDLIVKLLSGDYPLYEIVFLRSLIALTVLFGFIVPVEGGLHVLRTSKLRLHGLRSLALVFASLMLFTGLAVMPLANAVAISFATPLIVTAMSVLFLREKVGPWRWAAVATGFLGVLIIVRPGADAFQLTSLLPLAAAFGYATAHTLTRRAGGSERGAALSFYPLLGFTLVSALIGLMLGDGRFATGDNAALDFILRAWIWPAQSDYLVIALLGVAGGFGGYLIGQAYRLCEAGLVAPFEYVALPLAMLWGVLFFADWPTTNVWIGSTLVVGSGLVSVWRELQHKQVPNRPGRRSAG
jgi:drug/metabolite transporter (DMT)-like permease